MMSNVDWSAFRLRYGNAALSSLAEFRDVIQKEDDLAALSALRSAIRSLAENPKSNDLTTVEHYAGEAPLASETTEDLRNLLNLVNSRVRLLLGAQTADVSSIIASAHATDPNTWEGSSQMTLAIMWDDRGALADDASIWLKKSQSFMGRAVSSSIPSIGQYFGQFLRELRTEAVATIFQFGYQLPETAFTWITSDKNRSQLPDRAGLRFVAGISDEMASSGLPIASWWINGVTRREVRLARAGIAAWTIDPDELAAGMNVPARHAMDRRAVLEGEGSRVEEWLWRTNEGDWIEFVGGGILRRANGAWFGPSPSVRPRPNAFLSVLGRLLGAEPARRTDDAVGELELLASVSPIGNISVITSVGGEEVNVDPNALRQLRVARDVILFD